jgi:hypothetical protein
VISRLRIFVTGDVVFQTFVFAAAAEGVGVEPFFVPLLDMFVAGVANIPSLWALLVPGRKQCRVSTQCPSFLMAAVCLPRTCYFSFLLTGLCTDCTRLWRSKPTELETWSRKTEVKL